MKILVVDDSKLIRIAICNMVKEMLPTADISSAEDGQDALTKIDIEVPDIILLDVLMPKIDGIEFLSRIRELIESDRLKVIMITSIHDDDVLKKCFELGAIDFIDKPINKTRLEARLLKVVEIIEMMGKLKEANLELIHAHSKMLKIEKMAGLGSLAAGLAHEINNPLSYISTNLSVLETYNEKVIKMPDALEIKELFEDIREGIDYVSTVVSSLKRYSEYSDADLDEIYDLNKSIIDLSVITAGLDEDKIEFDLDLCDGAVVYGKRSQLDFVFLELVKNSIDAIKERKRNEQITGKISIRTVNDGDELLIELEDNGCGIDEDVIKNIFNPFYTTKSVGAGKGMALNEIYWIIVKEHGGTIEVMSELNEKTCFTIKLKKGEGLDE